MKETKQTTLQVNRVCLVTLKQPLLSQRNVPNRSSYRRKALKQSKTRIFGECANSLNTKATSLTVRGLKDTIGEHVAICEGVLSKMLRKTPFSSISDGWTSRRMQSYIAITCHWISNKWGLKSCALGCVYSSHLGTIG